MKWGDGDKSASTLVAILGIALIVFLLSPLGNSMWLDGILVALWLICIFILRW